MFQTNPTQPYLTLINPRNSHYERLGQNKFTFQRVSQLQNSEEFNIKQMLAGRQSKLVCFREGRGNMWIVKKWKGGKSVEIVENLKLVSSLLYDKGWTIGLAVIAATFKRKLCQTSPTRGTMFWDKVEPFFRLIDF